MLELFHRARWDQAYDFLASGEPPIIFRLLAVNTLFFILFVIRRAKGAHRMRPATAMQIQALLVVANCIVLFQNEVQWQLMHVISRI